jgi:excisionase family DNA binding protein
MSVEMATIEQPRTLLSPAEVAARLGCSTSTVRRQIRAGSFPAYRLGPPGSAVRLDWREVQDWLRGDPEGAA